MAFYWLVVSTIVCMWIYAFRAYFDHYDSLHPDIAWAVPWVQADVVRIDGILLWDEEVVVSPVSGAVRYPMGHGPLRVPRGAVVAKVYSGATVTDVKTRSDGYFIAGLDGSEEKWRYSTLWPGSKELPIPSPVKMMDDGMAVKRGERIGKLAPQPQDLRLIGYVDLSGGIAERLASNNIMAKMDDLDTPSRAYVRVFEVLGHRAKVYLNVPWFPVETLMSRKYRLLIETGESAGVVIPETAVSVRGERRGAFVIRGSDAVFVDLKGRAIDGGRFLVTDGLRLGDAVVVDAGSAREGRVRLW
jgi:hypothetical protein